jgi:hypothetical protein
MQLRHFPTQKLMYNGGQEEVPHGREKSYGNPGSKQPLENGRRLEAAVHFFKDPQPTLA